MVKKKKSKYLYPITPKTFHQYAASLFKPIKRGECVTTIWVPMAGRRMWNKFIIENIELFKKELPEYQKYLLAYVEPLDLTEESIKGYLRLMGMSFIATCQKHKKCNNKVKLEPFAKIFTQDSASYSKLLRTLKSLIKEATECGFEIVFFLGEFDELAFANKVFYHNLKSLWDKFEPRVHYIFLTITDLTTREFTDRLGELNAATLQNVIYVPIYHEEIDYLLKFFGERLAYQFTQKEKKLIEELCGGHPYLVKAASRIISCFDEEKTRAKDLREILLSHYEMLGVARRIFNLRTEEEKEILNRIALGKTVRSSSSLKRLISLRLIKKKEEGKYTLFGKLLNLVAKRYQEAIKPVPGREANGLYLDEKEGIVCCGGVPIEEKFTGQEYNVIKFFLEEQGKLRTREEIGEVLWGEESYERYSNWAIDQLMSKLRKKLRQLETKAKVVTLRGRGFKLV
jgi:hypothetical protein